VATRGVHTPVSTIQETSKQLKLHVLISALLFWVGFIWSIVGASGGVGDANIALAMLMCITGMVWYLVTKIRVWWHHK
jgi:hypothetical protein